MNCREALNSPQLSENPYTYTQFVEQDTSPHPLDQRQLDLRLLAQRGGEMKLREVLHFERGGFEPPGTSPGISHSCAYTAI